MTKEEIKKENIVLISCSGAEYHGELAHQVAIRLAEQSSISEISSKLCTTILFKNALLKKDRLVEITKRYLKHNFIVVIDGCKTSCASKILKTLEINSDLIITVQDIVPKPKMNLNDLSTYKNLPKLSNLKEEDLEKVTNHILEKLKANGFKFE